MALQRQIQDSQVSDTTLNLVKEINDAIQLINQFIHLNNLMENLFCINFIPMFLNQFLIIAKH